MPGCPCDRGVQEASSEWAVSKLALLGWSMWIFGFDSLATALMVFQVLRASDYSDINFTLTMITVSSRAVVVVISTASAVAYLRVATRGPPRPRELHGHGLLLMLIMPEMFASQGGHTIGRERVHQAAWWFEKILIVSWCLRRVLFIRLVERKISALGPPQRSCWDIKEWSRRCIALMITLALCATVYNLWLNFMVLRGIHVGHVLSARLENLLSHGVVLVDIIVLRCCMFLLLFSLAVGQCASFIFVCTCRHWIKAAEAKLVLRCVAGPVLSKVQRQFRHHYLAICLSLLTTISSLVASTVDGANLLVVEERENTLAALLHMFDVIGDVIAILILSGIGTLIWREDSEAGDVSAHIRSLLHSAVLTSRVDVTFEGAVFRVPSNSCIVSFPGKYLSEWRSMTWLCEQQLLSTACVFLPASDPQERFGRHVECPQTPRKCWCTSLYGDVKPWGCCWFDAWKTNIETAVELGLDLIVVFFQGECGQGIVEWHDLPTSDLWNGIGLGGSQKAEVAFLRRQGYAIVQEDVEATRWRIQGLVR